MSEKIKNTPAGLDDLPPNTVAVAQSALDTLRQSDSPLVGFVQLLGVQFESYGDGRCQSSLDVRPHLLNPLGIAHGAVTFALADTSCGLAAITALTRPNVVTQDMQIRYHGPVRPGRVTCTAEVVHKGQRTITTAARIVQDDNLVATVSGTFAILSQGEREKITR